MAESARTAAPEGTDRRGPSVSKRKRGWKAAAVAVIVVVLLASALLTLPSVIVPPATVAEPARVYVLDYGYHSGLLLPRSPQEAVEYTYGEWKWFAHNETGPLDLVRALAVRSEGTLGRRVLPGPIEQERWRARLNYTQLHHFEVEQQRVTALLEALEQRYERNLDSEVFNRRMGTHFVLDEVPYTLANNCNRVLAQWLKDLGCEVRGPAMRSSWKIRRGVDP